MDAIWPTASELAEAASTYDGRWVLDTETDGLQVRGPMSRDKAWIVGLMPEDRDIALMFDTRHPEWPKVKEILGQLSLVGHNLRFDLHAMNLMEVEGEYFDSMCGAYHLNTSAKKSLDDLGHIHGMPKIKTLPELIGRKGAKNSIHLLTSGVNQWRPKLIEYLIDDLRATRRLYQYYSARYNGVGDGRLEIALARMEDRGVKLKEERLSALRNELTPMRKQALQTIRQHGFNGNLDSPVQLKAWLSEFGYDFYRTEYDKKQRKRVRKWTTDSKKVLMPYLAQRPDDTLIQSLLDYRVYNKKIRDFCDVLPKFVGADGLIHGLVKSTRTATKRMAHADPNLAQIPKQGKTDQERRVAKAFRECFTGQSGWCSGADYSQVELRVAAALSGDARMLQAFADKQDLHTATACATSGSSPSGLPDGERFKAKAVNFGILNGMRAKRLALQIGTSVEEATRFLEKHREAHPELHDWMDSVNALANQEGLVEGLDGSIRIYETGAMINSAVSMKVQGGAALLMREGIVAADEAGLRPIITVHDELVGDVRGKADDFAEVMRHAANSYCPELFGAVDFVADGGEGDSWAHV